MHGGFGEHHKSFQMANGVAIYGGFDPSLGDVAWEDRDWVNNRAILSGDIGVEGDAADNSYHVFYHPGDLDSTAILDGFTITGGNADGNWPHGYCGGMHNHASSPTLTNCTFEANSAGIAGGGMYSKSSSPTLTNCTFERNQAIWGSGMYNSHNCSPTLTNCTFAGNQAEWGGGMSNWDSSSPTLTNCILRGDRGNEISDYDSSPVVIYPDIHGGYEGEGNIDADPLFVDPDNGDYHLGEGSPCIDAGTNVTPDLPAHDFEDDDRVIDGDGYGTATVDMGVDEVPEPEPVPITGLQATNDSPTPLGRLTTLMATITSGNSVDYAWAYGDGDVGSGALVTHIYPAIDTYTAVVTASNSLSLLTATTTVVIQERQNDIYLPLVLRLSP